MTGQVVDPQLTHPKPNDVEPIDVEVSDVEVSDVEVSDVEVSDVELAELAMAADPDAPVGDGAVSIWDLAPPDGSELLPDWYMPAPAAGMPAFRGWKRWLILLIVITFVALEAYGLCSTYGQVVLG